MNKPKIVILGAGYGGVITSKKMEKMLKSGEADVTLINKHDYHYISTQLHKAGAGTAPDEKIALSIPELLDMNKITLKKGIVDDMNFDKQEVYLETGETISYDYLLIALGFELQTFGIPGVEEHAFKIRSFRSTKAIYHHMVHQFEQYVMDQDESRLTFTVAGGGFTGVEMIGELVDITPKLCKSYGIPHEKVRIVNVEALPTLLPGFDKEAIEYTTELLQMQGVEVMTSTKIVQCTENTIAFEDGSELPSRTLIWSGGVRGNTILEKVGIPTFKGRVQVDQYLQVPGLKNVFCIGDCSVVMKDETTGYPPTAQMAIQQAEVCGPNLVRAIRGEALKPFEFDYKGTCASLGSRYAVGKVFGVRIKGLFAAFMKQVIEARYLFVLGGPALVVKQFMKGLSGAPGKMVANKE